jgi:hypothetical protein
MGESIVEQRKEDYREQERSSGLADEGAFVSPEELEGLLATLDTQDDRFLEGTESLHTSDNGDFLSPEDIDSGQVATESVPQQRTARDRPARPASDIDDPVYLSRIASELRSIKSELSQLKSSYDDAASQTVADSQNQKSEPGTEQGQEQRAPQTAQMPDVLYQDMKKLLAYLDRLLESLPEEKIDQFARSEYFDLYRKVFEYFDLV